MNKQSIINAVNALFAENGKNVISRDAAIRPDLAGVKMFEQPLIGFGSAADALFSAFKAEGVIGPWFMSPQAWLPDGKTVISLFFPFTEAVKSSNRDSASVPSALWLHGRIEGQQYITDFAADISGWFKAHGVQVCVPILDKRFRQITPNSGSTEYGIVSKEIFGSNWSERHAAYVCGLGTFGLSKGLITEKGMAGRFLSCIISEEIPPDTRPYTDIYAYCIRCGACIERCPVNAISFEQGKVHSICSAWLNKTAALYKPRYGCGLCQTAVPCESCNPVERRMKKAASFTE